MVNKAEAACNKAVKDLCGRLDDNYFKWKGRFNHQVGVMNRAETGMKSESSGLRRDGCGTFKYPHLTVRW